ncbi:hypothetical protein J2847_003307 [Azospirillum agricola]|uniref:hypothetical protein n=1 Tax=Azospirillum agricola TaxID=1720247 RepID=UPI001AE27B33|nr:hypothetical protein [Azospirillum agricola]MBP2230004.1 hypothetical protein [Azospirillum agricola]
MSASAILKLQKVGFTAEQVEALADFMDTQAASKADLGEAKAELKADIAAVRSELRANIADVRSDLRLLEQRMTVKLGGMLLAFAGVLLAAIRYLPLHP